MRQPAITDRLRRTFEIVGSLWLTLGLISGLAGLLFLLRWNEMSPGVETAGPMLGLCINLTCALFANPRLRHQAGLLTFHVALAIIAFLVALGRLTELRGKVEVGEGATFDPELVVARIGPLHGGKLDKVAFIQLGFDIGYESEMARRNTQSRVVMPDGSIRLVGDDTPLVIEGYRFYTTANKGFAPVIVYTGPDGADQAGALHMPSYPINEANQSNTWFPPDGSAEVTFWLSIPKPIYDEKGQWRFRLPEEYSLVVHEGDRRTELKPGEDMALGRGRLKFEELRTWMGYTIFYDPTLPWLLAAVGVAVAGMTWHIITKFRATPWDKTDASVR